MGVKKTELHFFTLGVSGEGISGGDRIFIEFARRWSKKHKINIYTSFEGARLIKKSELIGENINIITIPNKRFVNSELVNYIFKIFYSLLLGARLNISNSSKNVLYSASNFWMDTFPAFILKFRDRRFFWVASWYMSPPNPFVGYKEGKRKNAYYAKALYFWFMLSIVKPLVRSFSDGVLVNNEQERKQFVSKNKAGRVYVVLGAVDIEKISRYVNKQKMPSKSRKYDCVYQGRFHPQKGVVELIHIWRIVVKKHPTAKLAMIGDGPLMGSVKKEILKYGLQKNVKLFGYLFDGDNKYSIFSSSRVVVHPAYYDSGGMAAAEAMAFGLPCVGYDLSAYKSYYPKGMIKVPVDDKDEFASKICELLSNNTYYNKVAKEAVSMIKNGWGWDKRARDTLAFINGIQI